jgi:hypothetical protein
MIRHISNQIKNEILDEFDVLGFIKSLSFVYNLRWGFVFSLHLCELCAHSVFKSYEHSENDLEKQIMFVLEIQ